MSVPSDQKSETDVKTGVTPAGADAGVTPEQIWASLRTLARQIAVLVRETVRIASHRAMIWARDRHSAIRSAGARFRNRWPDAKAGVASSTANLRWPSFRLKTGVEPWRASSKLGRFWPRLRSLKFRAKYLVAALAICYQVGSVFERFLKIVAH